MSYSVKHYCLLLIILLLQISRVFAECPVSFTGDLPLLKSIVINGDSLVMVPADPAAKDLFYSHNIVLSHNENNIEFDFENAAGYSFQFFLQGFDKSWTSWKQTGLKEYTNLPAGLYKFNARFRGPDNVTGELPLLTVKVLPLWYFSSPAIIIYFFLISLVVWAIYKQLDLGFARKQYLLEQIINKRTEDLIIEKEKSETLLANVLPKNTATEIMAKGKATKIKYNFVTVLFSDIQGFTKIAEEMNPEVLIDELDKFFFYIDSIIEKYGIEKIKTIGDAYMCAGGIPEKNRTNPVEVILAALEMKMYMSKLKETSLLKE